VASGHGPGGDDTGRTDWTAGVREYLPAGGEDADYYDFALVRLDKDVRASAALPSFGAPTGLNDSQSDSPVMLHTYGQGTGVSAVSPERDLLATTLKRADHVYAHGALLPGDSGAPVIDAEGNVIGTVLGAGGMPFGVGIGVPRVGHDGALNRIGRVKPVLSHASAALRLRLSLVTARG
jgi:hypothetical protein